MNLTLPPAAEQWVERFGGRRRVMIAGVGLATVVLILGLSRWATAPTYVPVFSGLPLESVGQVTDRLTEEGIPFRLESGGEQVLVPTEDVARARVALAQSGLPSTGRPGMELFDQPSWGMTDFAQRINYRRALEGELERTIGKMRGVESAKVHLAMDENRAFLAETRPAEASVVLGLAGGRSPSEEVVVGIQHLVASSVDGLTSDNVTVVDHTGRLLSAPSEDGSLAALTSRQLAVQSEIETHLRNKAEQLLAQVLGPANSQVRVSAEVNFDRVERTTEMVDPELQVLANEQRSEIIPGAEGGAGSVSTSANYENSRSMEVFSGATGTVERLSVAVLVNDKRVEAADGTVTYEPRSDAELARIESLVRSAVGIEENRGDVISVVSMPFTSPLDTTEPAPSFWTLLDRYDRQAFALLALLVVAFVGLRAIRSLRPDPVAEQAQLAAARAEALGDGDETAGELPPADVNPELEALLAGTAVKSENERVREAVTASITEDPDIAVRLARAWMREG